MRRVPRIIEFLPGHDAGHIGGPLPEEVVPGPDDYAGYFANEYGEEIVFVQRLQEPHATVVHSDFGWEPVKVTDVASLSGGGERGPTIGGQDGIVLDEPEAAWVRACWFASELYRQPSG